MALYPKNKKYYYLKEWDSTEFEHTYNPEEFALVAGIYRCEICGHEIGHPGNAALPPYKPPNHPHKPPEEWRPILWRLIVSANHPHKLIRPCEEPKE